MESILESTLDPDFNQGRKRSAEYITETAVMLSDLVQDITESISYKALADGEALK